MDKYAAINGAFIILIIAAVFYPPLAALIGQGVQVFISLGVLFGVVYYALRKPWRAAYLGLAIGVLLLSILVAFEVNKTQGSTGALLSWMAFMFVTPYFLSPVTRWLDQKELEANRSDN